MLELVTGVSIQNRLIKTFGIWLGEACLSVRLLSVCVCPSVGVKGKVMNSKHLLSCMVLLFVQSFCCGGTSDSFDCCIDPTDCCMKKILLSGKLFAVWRTILLSGDGTVKNRNETLTESQESSVSQGNPLR